MRLGARLLVLAGALVLSACGFHPLYGTGSFPEGAQAAFAQIAVAPIGPTNDSDRIGYLLTDALDIALHPPGAKPAPKYLLTLKLADERRGLAIQDNASITRYNYRLTADWTLTPAGVKDAKAVGTGTAETTASYNVVDSQYATQVARNDAEERAAREVTELIKLKLAVLLGKPQ